MKTHQTVMEEEPVTCSVCGNQYSSNKYLNRHMKLKHPRLDIIVKESVGFMILEEELIFATSPLLFFRDFFHHATAMPPPSKKGGCNAFMVATAIC